MTANEILKGMVGDLMFEIATLRAKNLETTEKLVKVARMLPPEVLKEIAPELGLAGTVPDDSSHTAEFVRTQA